MGGFRSGGIGCVIVGGDCVVRRKGVGGGQGVVRLGAAVAHWFREGAGEGALGKRAGRNFGFFLLFFWKKTGKR